MLPTGTFSSPASAVIEVRDLHHEVGLDMGIIFMYNMYVYMGRFLGLRMLPTGTFSSPASLVVSYRSGTTTTKSGLARPLIWYIICLCRSTCFNFIQLVPKRSHQVNPTPSLREVKTKLEGSSTPCENSTIKHISLQIATICMLCDFQIVFDRMIPVRTLEEQIALAMGLNR